MFNVYYSEDALFDLQDIANYISQDNSFYANKVITNIYQSIETLETFPFFGKERKDDLREIIEPTYKFKIIYKVNIKNKLIIIVSVFKYKNIFL